MTNLRLVEGRILVGPGRRNRNTKCKKGDSCSRILYHCSLLLGAAPHPPFHPTTTVSQNQLPISGKGSLADISLNPVDVRFVPKVDFSDAGEQRESSKPMVPRTAFASGFSRLA